MGSAPCLEATADPRIRELFDGSAIAADGEGGHSGMGMTSACHAGMKALNAMDEPACDKPAKCPIDGGRCSFGLLPQLVENGIGGERLPGLFQNPMDPLLRAVQDGRDSLAIRFGKNHR